MFEGTEISNTDKILEVRIPYYEPQRFAFNRASTSETAVKLKWRDLMMQRYTAYASYDGIEYYVPLNVPRIRFGLFES